MEANKRTKVTEELFNMVKIMTKGGATLAQTAKAFGISSVTVTYIRRANTYAEYKEIMLSASGGHKAKVKREAEEKEKEATAPKEEPKEHEATHETAQKPSTIMLVANQYIAEQLKKQTELLTLINNKLTLVAEDLGCFRDEKIAN